MDRYLLAALVACAASPAAATVIPAGVACITGFTPCLPDITMAEFAAGAEIDNPYFPVVPNVVRIYEGVEDGETVRAVQQLVGPGRELLGVQTKSVRDVEFVDGVIIEETFDYFAQDTDGNVWYFGEDVTNYNYDDEGNLIGTDSDSAWLAGVDGALPGFIMPAPDYFAVGFSYFQEFEPGNLGAQDRGEIVATDLMVTLGLGSFDSVLSVLETTPQDPDSLELNYYAPGIGQILTEEGLDEDLENPELVFPLVDVAQVPLPATLPLIAAALAGLAVVARRKG
jgi:hypothetical protein